MLKIKTALLSALTAALLGACGEVPLADAPTEPETALETAAASPYTYHEWYEGDASNTKTLISETAGFCWMTGSQSAFNAYSDQVLVYKYQGKWVLQVFGKVKWASATCLNWSGLKVANSAFQPARMVSNMFSSVSTSCGAQTTKTWWGDAATYISGLGGDLDGIGGVSISQSTDGFKPSDLISSRCGTATDAVYGRAHAMFFGKPQSGDLPQFWGPNGQGVKFGSAGQYRAVSYGPKAVEMAPTDKAFCYLSYVFGDFDATGDWVWLYRGPNSAGKEVWKLNVRDSNAKSGDAIGAYATCYMLTQY